MIRAEAASDIKSALKLPDRGYMISPEFVQPFAVIDTLIKNATNNEVGNAAGMVESLERISTTIAYRLDEYGESIGRSITSLIDNSPPHLKEQIEDRVQSIKKYAQRSRVGVLNYLYRYHPNLLEDYTQLAEDGVTLKVAKFNQAELEDPNIQRLAYLDGHTLGDKMAQNYKKLNSPVISYEHSVNSMNASEGREPEIQAGLIFPTPAGIGNRITNAQVSSRFTNSLRNTALRVLSMIFNPSNKRYRRRYFPHDEMTLVEVYRIRYRPLLNIIYPDTLRNFVHDAGYGIQLVHRYLKNRNKGTRIGAVQLEINETQPVPRPIGEKHQPSYFHQSQTSTT